MQTRNMPLTELEPEGSHILGWRKLSVHPLLWPLIVRRRHRKVENRTEQETKSGGVWDRPSCGLQTYLDCCNPKLGCLCGSIIAKILFEIIVRIIFIVQTRQRIRPLFALCMVCFIWSKGYSLCDWEVVPECLAIKMSIWLRGRGPSRVGAGRHRAGC